MTGDGVPSGWYFVPGGILPGILLCSPCVTSGGWLRARERAAVGRQEGSGMWIWVSSNAVLPLCLYYWIRGPDNQLLNLLCHIMEGRGVKLHMVVQRPGNWATVLHVDVRVPPVPVLDGRGQMIALVCTGESAMAALSRQESLVSLPRYDSVEIGVISISI